MPCFGCDASDFDWTRGPMDVGAMVRDGIVFFTHKATEGTHIQHVHYGEAMNRAQVAGMPCMGAYMIPRTPGNNGHGTIPQQVAYFLAYLDAQTPWWRSTPEFFIQVDTEHWGYDNVAPELGAQACALLKQQTGKWVIHYAPPWAYGDTIPGDDPLWASSYGTNPAVPYRQAYPGDDSSGWGPYSRRVPTFLQYGSRLTIGGQPGCDANAFRGTLDQLRALITQEDTVITLVRQPNDATVWRCEGGIRTPIPSEQHLKDIEYVASQGWSAPLANNGQIVVAGNLDAFGVVLPDATQPAPVASTQDQFDAAVLKALQDQTVLKGIGDAIASHLHVS